ncbi:MAG: AzlC family ABC transporter permease [Pseudomonadota bacterium]
MTDPVTLTWAGTRDGARRFFALSLFIVPFGVAFGVAAVESGLTPLQAVIMSAAVFTAMAQFAALEFLVEPIAYLSLAIIVFTLSARHIIMGAALSPWVNQLPLAKRCLVLTPLTDATFADAQIRLRDGRGDLGLILGGGLLFWFTWCWSTALGAYGGDLLGDLRAFGFGVVMLSFFAATALDQTRRFPRLVWPVLIAIGISILTLPYLPTGWNIILAALVGGVLSLVFHHE